MIGDQERKVLNYRKRVHAKTKEYKDIDSRFTDYNSNVKAWKKFFNLNCISKDDIILDFGCCVGFSILVGRELGYNVYGVDVEYEGPYKGVNDFRNMYDTMKYIKIYDGYNLPYNDNEFTVIVGKVAFDKFNTNKRNDDEKVIEKMIEQRLKEFDRITTRKKLIVSNTRTFITPEKWEEYGFNLKIFDF